MERGRAKMAERAARPQFDDGVPLPPEPEEEFAAPPEDYQPAPRRQVPPAAPAAPTPAPVPPQAEPTPDPEASRREEEKMMVEEAQRPGTFDRRDATTIAVELLAQELGARKL